MKTIKELVNEMNQIGVPLPLLKDPKTGRASVSMTMMVLSFNTALLGQLGKFTKLLGDVDMTSAMSLFVATSALYFGRQMQTNGKVVTLNSDNNSQNEVK